MAEKFPTKEHQRRACEFIFWAILSGRGRSINSALIALYSRTGSLDDYDPRSSDQRADGQVLGPALGQLNGIGNDPVQDRLTAIGLGFGGLVEQIDHGDENPLGVVLPEIDEALERVIASASAIRKTHS